jgi:uncharacterized protein (DUF58 family)
MQFELPQEYEFGSLEWLSRQMMEGFVTGLHKSPFHGFSVEFSEHAMYNPGESTRHIDWKLYGKTDRLYTKKFEEETNLKCRILIDTSGSMLYPLKGEGVNPRNPNKLQFSLLSAAMLYQLMRRQRDAFALSLFDDSVYFESDMASTQRHHRFIMSKLEEQLLAEQKLGTPARIADSLHRVADTQSKRSLVIVFSDFFCENENEENDLLDALHHLTHNKHDVILYQVSDHKTEWNLEFGVEPHRMIGLEGEQELKLTPEEVKGLYLEEVERFRKKFFSACLQWGIDAVEADIQQDYRKVSQQLLIKRQKVS